MEYHSGLGDAGATKTQVMSVDAAEFIQETANNVGKGALVLGFTLGTGASLITNWIVEGASGGGGKSLLAPVSAAVTFAWGTRLFLKYAKTERSWYDSVVGYEEQDVRQPTKAREPHVVSPQALLKRTKHEVFGSKVINFMAGFAYGWSFGSAASGGAMWDNGLDNVSQFAPYIAQSIGGLVTGVGLNFANMSRKSSLKKVLTFGRGNSYG